MFGEAFAIKLLLKSLIMLLHAKGILTDDEFNEIKATMTAEKKLEETAGTIENIAKKYKSK